MMEVQLWVAAVFIGLALLIFVGIGRIVAEGLCNGLWIVIDYFTGKISNRVFTIG